MMTAGALAVWLVLWKLNVQFPVGGGEPEQIVLRWLHFVAGIIWVGLLYFFNLVNAPAMKALDAATRGKVVPVLMPKALRWFRWGAVVTWLAGFRYFMILAKTDAINAHAPGLMWRWLGIWSAVWLVAFVIIYALLRPADGLLNNGWLFSPRAPTSGSRFRCSSSWRRRTITRSYPANSEERSLARRARDRNDSCSLVIRAQHGNSVS